MSESPSSRLSRMTMRSWRRGMKEMDLILGPFADANLAVMSPEAMAQYDRLLGENDQDLYSWVAGASAPPPELAPLIRQIADFAFAGQRSGS